MTLVFGSVMVQVAVGGLAFCWVTTRHRVVGIGYGWLLRITYAVIAFIGVISLAGESQGGGARVVEIVAAVAMILATLVALAVSVVRRAAGVSGQRAERARKLARVAAMVGLTDDEASEPTRGAEFPPVLDLVAPAFGIVALVAAAAADGGPYLQSAARYLVGAAFLGAVSDAMLLGHWYLVQPGLSREPVKELVRWTAYVWPLDVLVWLWPVGMVSVLTGSVKDGWGGLLGWTWQVCAVTTIGLVGVTWAALRERYYSAVMAATGLMYLAILTAFGQDLLARAVLSQ
ncbi:MAG: hypothetical protein ACOYNI_04790 [Acidimicrobiia bacterium]